MAVSTKAAGALLLAATVAAACVGSAESFSVATFSSSTSNSLARGSHPHDPQLTQHPRRRCKPSSWQYVSRRSLAAITALSATSLDELCQNVNTALSAPNIINGDAIKACKVRVGSSTSQHRLCLIASENIRKNDVVLSLPYDDAGGTGLVWTPTLATKVVYKGTLPEGYDGWTGDAGLLAMLLLNEMARCDEKGVQSPKRDSGIQSLITAWIQSLPSPDEMTTLHPLMWTEDDQETLQGSSTNKLYRLLDDIDDDATWLEEKVWSTDRDNKFPAEVKVNGEDRPCFSSEGFRYALSLVYSRSFYVDGQLRLMPVLDYANHDDDALLGSKNPPAEEMQGGTMGTFGTVKGAVLRAGRDAKVADEVFVSYGPKSASEYLLEHGFVPPSALREPSAELAFELDENDIFRDDKLDVLEYETYDLAPMEPTQKFDVAAGKPGLGGGEPDPAMIQFLRLVKLSGHDAFLLESIFRKEVWGFMGAPVSERNERQVVDAVIEACEKALGEMDDEVGSSSSKEKGDGTTGDAKSPTELCAAVREAERKALSSTVEYMKREKEALDLKEYYQERRLKDLGLDSEWSPEDEYGENPDVGWGQTRAPGGADYDW